VVLLDWKYSGPRRFSCSGDGPGAGGMAGPTPALWHAGNDNRIRLRMRLFIYGMESSGASTFCLFLGQRAGTVTVVDLWSQCLAPPLVVDVPIVLKATVTATYRAEDHLRSFRPDASILFLRDPVAVYRSLIKYEYANYEGSVEQKLIRFDEEYSPTKFDLVIRYEDFVRRDPAVISAIDELGWICSSSYYDLPRSLDDIRETNFHKSPWLHDEYNKKWSFGNFKGASISSDFVRADHPPEIVSKVAGLSPRLTKLYGLS
jgi:hypothetical protein